MLFLKRFVIYCKKDDGKGYAHQHVHCSQQILVGVLEIFTFEVLSHDLVELKLLF